MNCQDVQPFVSALHDGETIPKEAAEHIGACPDCKARLREYAQMAIELRLLDSASEETAAAPLRHLPSQGRHWARTLTARVLVPRFALGLGVIAILGLSAGLGLTRAQSGGLWFQFEVTNPENQAKVGGLIQAGEPEQGGFVSAGPGRRIGFRIKALDVQNDAVRLAVRTRLFEPKPGSDEEKVADYQAAVVTKEVLDRIFANTPERELNYGPGQTLEIPVEGGSKIVLSGRVFQLRPSFPADWYSVTPKPDEIVLSKAGLVRGNEFLGEIQGSGGGRATNSAVGVCVPPEGAFIIALKPFEGAIQGVAEFGQVHFKLDGQDYILFSATPITGGQQPREVWVYHAPHCPPSWGPGPKVPLMIGVGDVSNVLDALKR